MNVKFEMQIHNMKFAESEEDAEPVELTEDQKKAMDIALKRAKERKAREYGRSTND